MPVRLHVRVALQLPHPHQRLWKSLATNLQPSGSLCNGAMKSCTNARIFRTSLTNLFSTCVRMQEMCEVEEEAGNGRKCKSIKLTNHSAYGPRPCNV